MAKERMKLTPPWIGFFNKLEALFEYDSEVTLRYVEDPTAVRVYVNNPYKAAALEKLLPKSRDFGGKTVYIEVIPANKDVEPSKSTLFKTAFEGNLAFREMIEVDGLLDKPVYYCMFAKDVVQYWDDNFGDPHGNVSTLYETIARDIFEDSQVFFSTDEY